MTEISKLQRIVRVATVVGAAGLLVTGCAFLGSKSGEKPGTTTSTLSSAALASDERLTLETGYAMEAAAIPEAGGWTYASQIQGGEKQTDRDVGTASVGMGFLALAKRYPKEGRWVTDAQRTATWLMAVSHKDGAGNVWWTDCVDCTENPPSLFTSFDDGPPGIGDFFWQLSEVTSDPNLKAEYQTYAKGSIMWLLSQAETVHLRPGGAGSRVTTKSYEYDAATGTVPGMRWIWDISTRGQSADNQSYYSGMGEGIVGDINLLATYYQRTGDKNSPEYDAEFSGKCLDAMKRALNYLDYVRDTLGSSDQGGNRFALPETELASQDGGTVENSGYLSGAAGAAYMYLNLYQIFGDPSYKTEAENTLNWLITDKNVRANVSTGVAWHISYDPQDPNNVANAQIATGGEEGATGTGEVFVQAAEILKEPKYLDVARQAADYLMSVGISDGKGGLYWPEDFNSKSRYMHPNLNNGVAGISMFLATMAEATNDQKYLDGAQKAAQWLKNTASIRTQGGTTTANWADIDDDSSDPTAKPTPFSGDQSEHWGNAGRVKALTYITSIGQTGVQAFSSPVEEPALVDIHK